MSSDQTQLARIYAAGIERDLARSLRDGTTKANNGERWAAELDDEASAIEAGLRDGNFTIRQRMNLFLTGESVPFLKGDAQ